MDGVELTTSKCDIQDYVFFHQVRLLHMWMGVVWNLCKHIVIILLICIDLTKDNIIQYYGHGMDQIMEVLPPCLWTLLMRSPMRMTLKNHGFSTWVGFWHWMISPPMLKEIRITTNIQFQMPPQKKPLPKSVM